MGEMNGITVAKKIREKDQQTLLVFLTHISSYAIQGYAVQASDYILKPLSYELFSSKMKEWVRRAEKNRIGSILIASGGENRKVPVDEIYYLETAGHRLIYHTENGSIEVWGRLRDAQETLAGRGFALCNKCYLVNLRHVERINGNTVTVGPEELLISRPRKQEFLQAVSDYIGGV